MLSFNCVKGLVSSLLFARLAFAAPSSQELEARVVGSCNTASNRACWSDGFDIHTDYETKTPAGKTVTYNLEVTEKTNWLGPDGVTKEKVMLINNQLPGPTIFADWGDTIVVNVKNSLATNGTSIHWHGMRQFHTNSQDGANGVTECPLAPGKSKTYTFKAQQYGTSWYHSHFSAQYGNGVSGQIIINGPASLPYDIDLGAFPISDYYYTSADKLVLQTQVAGPPPSDNIMFNGTNINPLNPSQGKYANVTLTPGKRHRLRLINNGVENNFQVTLVGHQFTVIAADLVPVNSFTTDNIYIGIGQRYDVTIDASQAVDNYWFNVTISGGSTFCGSSVNAAPAAIFHYAGASGKLPTKAGTKPVDAWCQDNADLTPVVTRNVDLANFSPTADDTLSVTSSTTGTITWFVDGSSINVDWDRPVLEYVLEGNTSYPHTANLIQVDAKDAWTYWLIQNQTPIPHPMHLHGHDFLVLGRSAPITSFSQAVDNFTASDISGLKKSNPTRRDVTMLPGYGWLVIAFLADNPGNWLFHCHIAWHASGGLAVDFMERVSEQKAFVSSAQQADFEKTCSDWNAYYPTDPFKKIDSGLKR